MSTAEAKRSSLRRGSTQCANSRSGHNLRLAVPTQQPKCEAGRLTMNDTNSPSKARANWHAWRSPCLGQRQAHWPPRPGHVRLIRAKPQLERDLALFNLAIDRKLRGCDLVALRLDDVAPNGYAVAGTRFEAPYRRAARFTMLPPATGRESRSRSHCNPCVSAALPWLSSNS